MLKENFDDNFKKTHVTVITEFRKAAKKVNSKIQQYSNIAKN